MFRKAAMVVNPRAGSYDRAVLEEMTESWPQLSVYVCDAPGDAARLARRARVAGAQMVIAAGGDGTAHQVVNGLAGDFEATAVAILPLGTGNDLARTLEMPLDVPGAMSAIRDGAERRLDLIRVDLGREAVYCVNSATGGFSIRIEEKMTRAAKAVLGPLAYLVAAARSADEACEYQTTIRLDDRESVTLNTPNIAIVNGRTVGGGYEVAPRACPSDGLLDIVAVTAQTLGDRLKLLASYAAGQHLESVETFFRQARRVRIDSDPPMPFSMDGEKTEGRSGLTFVSIPNALRVIVPSNGN